MTDLDKPTESSEQRAKRQWGNYDLTKRFLEDKKAYKEASAGEKSGPKIAEVIETERLVAEGTIRFERQFVKDLREMLENHTKRNFLLYKLSLRSQIHRLKFAKYKRLLAQQNQESTS
jgi:hypothetical protein